MAGCYKHLTRHINRGAFDKFIEGISEREAKGKSLNGWQKTVKRMQQYKQEGNMDTPATPVKVLPETKNIQNLEKSLRTISGRTR